MSTTNVCPQCGMPMSRKELMGVCPDCLLKAGLGSLADDSSDACDSRFVPPAAAELAAKFPQLDRLALIGCGGMGAVYQARQKALDRMVALKILPPDVGHDPSFAERFAREAKVLAKLNHANIVTLYEFGETEGLYYFLMEYVDGMNLRQLIRDGRIAPREALAIVPQICDALQYAHDQGIVHRDIKPENILLDRKGRVKVADFGLAKLVSQRGADDSPMKEASGLPASLEITEANRMMGTPPYMAPEQREHPSDVDHRADIYSLGVVFYQMLTGELPGAKLEPPSKKVVIDVRLDEVVLRALAQKPERRYQQVSDIKTMCATLSQAAPESERSQGQEAEANVTQTDLDKMSRDPANWYFHFIYFCRRDPRIIVPKRMTGLGWTVNLGNPWAVPFTVGLIGVALGIIKVAQEAGLTGRALTTVKIAVFVAIVWMCHTLSMARKPSPVSSPQKPTHKPRSWRKGLIQLALGVAFALAVKTWVLGSYRVSGSSLSPEIPGGSYVLAWKPARMFRTGDLIVYRQEGRILVGRVEGIDAASLVINRNGMSGERVSRERLCGKIVTVLWRGSGRTSKKENTPTP